MVIQTWVFGRLFLKREQIKSVALRQPTVFIACDKMQAFEQKSEFWKTCICHREVNSFPILLRFFC